MNSSSFIVLVQLVAEEEEFRCVYVQFPWIAAPYDPQTHPFRGRGCRVLRYKGRLQVERSWPPACCVRLGTVRLGISAVRVDIYLGCFDLFC